MGLPLIPLAVVIVGAAVWWMMNMLIHPMLVTYDLGYGAILRNSAIMVLARLPWSVLFLALTAGLPALIAFTLPGGASVAQGWSGTFSSTGGLQTVTNAAWNGALAAGGSTTYGFIGSGTAPTGAVPVTCR